VNGHPDLPSSLTGDLAEMDLQYLVPKIRAILTAPAVDLATISAKRVRKQLIADGEDEDHIKHRKDQVDALIAQVYESVNNPAGGNPAPANGDSVYHQPLPPSSTPVQQKRKRSPSADQLPAYNFQSSQPQPLREGKRSGSSTAASTSGGASHVKSDAELARQLSFELNARSTRGGGAASSNGGSRTNTPKNQRGGAKKGSAKKSKATIDSEEEDDDDDEDVRPKKKKAKGGGGGGGGGFMKEYVLSEPLAQMTGHAMLSRPQAVKALWDHIKANNLQDPRDKREILCDAAMKAVFRTDRLNMFKMNKVLGDHLIAPGEQVE